MKIAERTPLRLWMPLLAMLLGVGSAVAEETLLPVPEAGCDAAAVPCEAAGEGLKLRFEVPDGAKPMRPFQAVLRLSGPAAATVRAVTAEFVMPGMDMGRNRYRFVREADGRWTARIVLPMCSMGGHDWLARLVLQGEGRRWRAEIPFRIE